MPKKVTLVLNTKTIIGILATLFLALILFVDSLDFKPKQEKQNTKISSSIEHKKAKIDDGACIGCHGDGWDKIALSKSHKVSQMSEEEIVSALLGYKNRTYGSDLKDIMRAQLETYSNEDIIELAKYISKKYSNNYSHVNALACYGCHGSDWSKSALGSSKIVATMTHKEIADALIGYKNGTFGGDKKELMRAQVEKYSDEELIRFSMGIGI